jgi:hypothetical protein
MNLAWKKACRGNRCMVTILAGVPERREAGAWQSAAVRGADAQQIMSRLFGRVFLRISYRFPGTLGQRGGRVTGKWSLAAQLYKGR